MKKETVSKVLFAVASLTALAAELYRHYVKISEGSSVRFHCDSPLISVSTGEEKENKSEPQEGIE